MDPNIGSAILRLTVSLVSRASDSGQCLQNGLLDLIQVKREYKIQAFHFHGVLSLWLDFLNLSNPGVLEMPQ